MSYHEIVPFPFAMPEANQRLVIKSPFEWTNAVAVFEPANDGFMNVRFIENDRITYTSKPIRSEYAWDLLKTKSITDWRDFDMDYSPWNPATDEGFLANLEGGVKL